MNRRPAVHSARSMSLWAPILIGILLVAAFWCIVTPLARRSAAVKRRPREVMTGRQSMTSEQFADAFFEPKDHATAMAVRDLLARVLIIDTSKIHPDDRLIADLGLTRVDGLDVNFLMSEVKDAFGISAESLFADNDPTIRQLVELCNASTADH